MLCKSMEIQIWLNQRLLENHSERPKASDFFLRQCGLLCSDMYLNYYLNYKYNPILTQVLKTYKYIYIYKYKYV